MGEWKARRCGYEKQSNTKRKDLRGRGEEARRVESVREMNLIGEPGRSDLEKRWA